MTHTDKNRTKAGRLSLTPEGGGGGGGLVIPPEME